jgi:hypothetical protein
MPKHVQPETVPLVIYDRDDGNYEQYKVNPTKSITVEVDGYPVKVDVGSKGAILTTRMRTDTDGKVIGPLTTQRLLTRHVPMASEAAKVLLYRKDHMKREKKQTSKKARPVSAQTPSNLQTMTKGGRAKTKAVPKPPHEVTKRKPAKR